MGLYDLAALTLTTGAIRLLPEHLDLFTACAGGAGIGGVLGGLIAVLADENIATYGVIGGAIGLVLGVVAVISQATGLHF